MDLYVSKLGNNSDGLSWPTAYHDLQTALLRVPDERGGHRVIVRPDTYAEANLFPTSTGAAGAYNEFVGDFDGSLGSGATGWVVIDSGAPEVIVRTAVDPSMGNPPFELLDEGDVQSEWGMKSVDWWCAFRSDPHHSGSAWDRWRFQGLYATGSEFGMGWDMTCDVGCEFSVEVDNCVGIGRFAGAGAIAHRARAGEPCLFRNSWFMNLDTWGDCGGVYIRGEDDTMPEHPHAVFENCTVSSPKKALQSAWAGVGERNTRVSFKDCRLVTLNFSQPRGEPAQVIRCESDDGRQLHVDLEDCVLVGYKVFGARAGKVSYTTKGAVSAYVEYEQPVPEGMQRLREWPVEVFADLLPHR
ncbi:MAG: hypothetical protein ABFE07_27945 [Armatimonadia bacterium]